MLVLVGIFTIMLVLAKVGGL